MLIEVAELGCTLPRSNYEIVYVLKTGKIAVFLDFCGKRYGVHIKL